MQHRRRLDQVLADDFVADLDSLNLDEVRERRRTAHEVENELSYYRRLLHGRLDLLRFEQRRRSGEEERSLIDALASILADPDRPAGGHGRHIDTDLPPLPDVGKREIDGVLGDDVLLNIDEIDDDGIVEAIAALEEVEARYSEDRRRVQEVEDVLSARLGELYRADTDQVGS